MSDRRRRKSLSIFRPVVTGLTPIHNDKDQVSVPIVVQSVMRKPTFSPAPALPDSLISNH